MCELTGQLAVCKVCTAELKRLVDLVREAVKDGPWVCDDGWYYCWFCGGDGDWDEDKASHAVDCVYVKLLAHLDRSADG